jgi:hypothetical protein
MIESSFTKFIWSSITVACTIAIAINCFILVLGYGYSFSVTKVQCVHFTLVQGFHPSPNFYLISRALLFVPVKILVHLDSILWWEIYLT